MPLCVPSFFSTITSIVSCSSDGTRSSPSPLLHLGFTSSSFSSSNRHRFLLHCTKKTLKICHQNDQYRTVFSIRAGYEVGGGFPEDDFVSKTIINGSNDKWDSSQYESLLKGGEQVTSVLEEMILLLEDMKMDEASEAAAVELAAQGVIGKRVDQMESGFMMALDYMIQLAEKDNDDQRKTLLEVIKQTVLSHLTKKCPPHVQVIGLLCRTPSKESRHELLRRVAAGGGVFDGEKNVKIQLPGANLNDIANQADDLLETMESRPSVPDRKLLARLVLIREEARNMMGGGILDERNDRGLNTLPEPEVNFLSKLVALKPCKAVQQMIHDVMSGKDEGEDNVESNEESNSIQSRISSGTSGRISLTDRQPLPVRPGMFLETVSKVLGSIYAGNKSGITAQQLEWIHQKTLHVLQEIAF